MGASSLMLSSRMWDRTAAASVSHSHITSPNGYRDIPSAALFLIPGIWVILNLKRSVFSFKFLNLGLGIPSIEFYICVPNFVKID